MGYFSFFYNPEGLTVSKKLVTGMKPGKRIIKKRENIVFFYVLIIVFVNIKVALLFICATGSSIV